MALRPIEKAENTQSAGTLFTIARSVFMSSGRFSVNQSMAPSCARIKPG